MLQEKQNKQLGENQAFLYNVFQIIDKYNISSLNNFKELSEKVQLCLQEKKITTIQLQILLEFLKNIQKLMLKNCEQIKDTLPNNFNKLKEIQIQNVFLKTLEIRQYQNLQKLKIECSDSLCSIIIQNCRKLDNLLVQETQIVWIKIQNLPKLTRLSLIDCRQLSKIQQKNCPALKKVSITNSQINLFSLSNFLENLVQIDVLNLSNSKKLSQLNINININHLKKLTKLNLNGTYLTKIHIQGLDQLKELNLFGMNYLTQIRIKHCNKLQQIQIGNSSINMNFVELSCMDSLKNIRYNSDSNIYHIKLQNLSNINQLSFSRVHLKLIQIINLSNLWSLDLQQCRGINFIKISQCNQLYGINLQNTMIQKVLFEHLRNLTYISFQNCLWLQQMQILCCDRLNSINFSGTAINQQKLLGLIKYIPNLKQLRLSFCKYLKQIDLSHSPRLQKLYLNYLHQSFVLWQIQTNQLNNLIELNLEFNNINNIEPIALIDFKFLDLLILSNNFISQAKSLNKTTKLGRELSLFNNPLSIFDFCKGLSKLQQLHLPYQARGLDCACILKLDSDKLGRYLLGNCTDRRPKFKEMLIQRFINL